MKLRTAAMLGLTVLGVAGSASAGSSASRAAHDANSRALGVTAKGSPVDSVKLFERVANKRRNDEVADELMEELDRRGHMKLDMIDRIHETDEHFLVGNADWKLSVRGKGEEARFRNHAHRRDNPGVDKMAPPGRARAEQVARSFIHDSLRAYLPQEAGEDLVAWQTLHDREGGVSKSGEGGYENTVATIVRFARELDGIPVVGRGSKVEVTLANDGTVIGFHYDWPKLTRSNKSQKLVSVQNGLERAAAMVGKRGPKVAVPSHECGYFDPGVDYRDEYAPVQAACVTAVIDTEEVLHEGRVEQTRSGIIVVAPMGEEVEYDSALEDSHPLLRGASAKGRSLQLGRGNATVRRAIQKGKVK